MWSPQFGNLTAYEELGLNQAYNLADGHAHQEQSDEQKRIVANLTHLFYCAEHNKQETLERRFKEEFFKLAGQASSQESRLCFLHYSASTALDVIAKYLLQRKLSVSLIHPTFDNLAAILKRIGVCVEPIEEEQLRLETIDSYLRCIKSDAIFLVCPNNPTGWVPDQTLFKKIIAYCKQERKLLLIDFCFRFFSADLLAWDQYQSLLDADIDFFTIEDTGKTWPTLDLKVGVASCNARLADAIHEIHSDLLLNVSPFILSLLCEYLASTRLNGLVGEITQLVETNRHFLRESLQGTMLTPASASSISVEWLRINSAFSAHALWELLRRCGIYILPGNYFFWNNQMQGDKYVRIALMRPVEHFREAVSTLRTALLTIAKT